MFMLKPAEFLHKRNFQPILIENKTDFTKYIAYKKKTGFFFFKTDPFFTEHLKLFPYSKALFFFFEEGREVKREGEK